MIYAVIAATSCFGIALYQWQVNRRVQSPLVRADISNWLVNGLISVEVGLAFALVFAIKKTPWAGFIPYADPTLPLILVAVALPIPLKTIAINLKQLLLGAPQAPIQAHIRGCKSSKSNVIVSKIN